MPPLAKFTNKSFRRAGGGERARAEPFPQALRGEMVVCVGSPGPSCGRRMVGKNTSKRGLCQACGSRPSSQDAHMGLYHTPLTTIQLFSPPRLALRQLHKIIPKYAIPQKLVASSKTAILNSLEKWVIDSIFK